MTQGTQITVIGAGLMGHGIAYVLAQAGHSVRVHDPVAPAIAALPGRLAAIASLFGHGDEAPRRVTGHTDLAEAASGADFVIEAAPETLALKQAVIAALEAVVSPATIIATNTSALPVTQIAAGALHPERIVGAHFWNPPHLVRLVEVVQAEATSDATVAATMALLRGIGHHPVHVKKDIPGFIALSAAHFAVSCGTVLASIIFIMVLPGLRAIVTRFSSPEFLMMMILGLVIASTLTGRSKARGLLMAGVGLMLSTVGQAPGSGDPRYVGPFLYLWEGVPMIPILLGLFGVPEVLDLAARNETIATAGNQVITMTTGLWQGTRDVLVNMGLVVRCSLIGVTTGFIPGLGGTAAEWMSYATAVATDKDKAS
jgi:predicted dinucleotide-binding enzyme